MLYAAGPAGGELDAGAGWADAAAAELGATATSLGASVAAEPGDAAAELGAGATSLGAAAGEYGKPAASLGAAAAVPNAATAELDAAAAGELCTDVVAAGDRENMEWEVEPGWVEVMTVPPPMTPPAPPGRVVVVAESPLPLTPAMTVDMPASRSISACSTIKARGRLTIDDRGRSEA